MDASKIGKIEIKDFLSHSREYYTSLKKSGIDAHFVAVQNGTHDSVVIDNVTDFDEAITNALNQCPTSPKK